jgi:hypothetical protein
MFIIELQKALLLDLKENSFGFESERVNHPLEFLMNSKYQFQFIL